MFNKRFLNQMTEFIFVEQEPKPADIIFVPGSGFPQIAEKAARLYREGFSPVFCPPESTASCRGNLQESRQRRKCMKESTGQSGNF